MASFFYAPGMKAFSLTLELRATRGAALFALRSIDHDQLAFDAARAHQGVGRL
jgi:hypothetical protein